VPDCRITPGGQTAAHSEAQVTAQQSMWSCLSVICDEADMGQLAAGTADAGPEATESESASHSMASRRRTCCPLAEAEHEATQRIRLLPTVITANCDPTMFAADAPSHRGKVKWLMKIIISHRLRFGGAAIAVPA
jgi:hypothetical protein